MSEQFSEHLITPELVELGKRIDGDKYAAIHEVARLIGASGRADADGLEAAMVAREKQFVTGLPGGIAIPHARTDAVTQPALGVLHLEDPIDFGAKDGPADLIIGIAGPHEEGSTHTKLLARLARALMKQGFTAKLRAAATQEEVVALVTEAVEGKKAPAGGGKDAQLPSLVAVTNCATGIAHTYMAAQALEQAAQKRGVDIHVETQGSGGINPITDEELAKAGAVILAHDVAVLNRERFDGMPIVESGVNRPISDAEAMIDEALAIAKSPAEIAASRSVSGEPVPAGSAASSDGSASSSTLGSSAQASGAKLSFSRRIQQALLTGVSYMIPFVAAGGLLTALGFLFGGYTITYVAGDIASKNSLVNLPDIASVFAAAGAAPHVLFGMPLNAYLGAIFVTVGGIAMGFLVAALSGYIAYALAGRPGIAPGFVGGAISVAIGAGFIGGLVTGILAGVVAGWLARIKAARWLQGLMPVVINPLVSTLIVGGLMYMVFGRPLAAIMTSLQNVLNGMTGSSQIILGIILGLMMCFDLGGPVNKAAYLFATAGLAANTTASWQIMAAVMASGMVPPVAMALSTVVRPKLYTDSERENGTAGWLLGLSFISEGAIPFAAADPFRVIPSMMAGGAVTGALTMALHVGSHAPHGGIFVFFAIDNFVGFLGAIAIGTLVSAALVTALKQGAARKASSMEVAARG
ncbi:MAG: fructose-specific PTS transporter subunit EIIC [Actinomycetaceae bacterium]|nr:fructose-specific PTS transporter subunit EIIC [Actinomycetaceae bacterium]MDY6083572.1 fructose-specific PTS transporter subunit EIIC [Actinomycetaceae bacterium]